MIQFTIEDQNKDKLRITAPHSWSELSLEQLLAIEDEKLQKNGLTKLFSIICGVEFHQITNSKDRSIFQRITEVCEFIKTPPDWDQIQCPEYIEVAFQAHKVNTRVSDLMHGQIELIAELGKKENLLELMPRTAAIIMQPTIDGGDYDGDRVDQIERKMLKAPALQVYGLASFFFGKLAHFLSIGIVNSEKCLRRTIRSKTYYSDWLKVIDLVGI